MSPGVLKWNIFNFLAIILYSGVLTKFVKCQCRLTRLSKYLNCKVALTTQCRCTVCM